LLEKCGGERVTFTILRQEDLKSPNIDGFISNSGVKVFILKKKNATLRQLDGKHAVTTEQHLENKG
jgi:hypothetical protein